MKYIRYIAYFIMFYVIAFIIWWIVLLGQLERRNFELQVNQLEQQQNTQEAYAELEYQFLKKRKMIVYEGLVFLILLIGSSLYVVQNLRKEERFNQLKRNFLLATTHEFKTPLSTTKLNLQTLQSKQLPGDIRNKLIHNSIIELNRLNDLVDNVLLASKLDSSETVFVDEKINISKLFHQLENQHQTIGNIKFDITDDIFIQGDEPATRIVIMNLLSNALKYSTPQQLILVSLNRSKNKAIITVKDEGIGIDPKEFQNIFKRFYRIEDERVRKTKGTGLGLFLVKQMVNRLKGEIKVAQNHPKGSIFTVSLPLYNEQKG